MVTGSMATSYWGVPRLTHDLDFVLVMQPTDVDKVVSEFREGFFLQPESVRHAFQPPYQFNAIDEQSSFKIDFWLLRDNAFEQHMFNRRVAVKMFGTEAWVATPEDMILHKLYWHSITPSERQLQDAAGVFKLRRDSLDVGYLHQWANPLNVETELQDLLSGRIKPKNT
jgi:hypothetical protein